MAQPPPAQRITPSAIAGYFSNGNGSGSNTSYDSAGGTVTSSNPSTGVFSVVFGGLGTVTIGNVELPESSEDTCTVVDWNSDGTDLTVDVECYDYPGNPANGTFRLTATKPTRLPQGALAYDWNSLPARVLHPKGPV